MIAKFRVIQIEFSIPFRVSIPRMAISFHSKGRTVTKIEFARNKLLKKVVCRANSPNTRICPELQMLIYKDAARIQWAERCNTRRYAKYWRMNIRFLSKQVNVLVAATRKYRWYRYPSMHSRRIILLSPPPLLPKNVQHQWLLLLLSHHFCTEKWYSFWGTLFKCTKVMPWEL